MHAKSCLAMMSAMSVFALAGTAGAQILADGNLDGLSPGTPPDCGVAAGGWNFPQNYIDALSCERLPVDYTVTETTEFDPNLKGNSLEMDISDVDPNYNPHLPNIFTDQIDEADGVVATITFDIFVPEKGRGGGSIYIGGDHGGGGFSNGTDRGPQIAWFNDGTMVANVAGVQTPLGAYNYGEWQSVQIDIDLATDTFDMFHGAKGGDLTQIADDLKFRVAALDHLDRFSWAHFGATVPSDHAYIDNVVVSVPTDECYPDCNDDDVLDFFDFLCYLNAFDNQDQYADCEDNEIFDFFDFLCYLNEFDAGC
jgi:hypothetical protein